MAQPWAGGQGQPVPSEPGPSPRSVPAADSREILALSTSASKVSANYRQLLLPPGFLGKVTQRRQERPKPALRPDLFPAAPLHPGPAPPSRWPGPPPPCGHVTTTPGQQTWRQCLPRGWARLQPGSPLVSLGEGSIQGPPCCPAASHAGRVQRGGTRHPRLSKA